MGSSNKHPLPILLLVMLLTLPGACTKPTGDFRFIAAETVRDQGGVYTFDIDFDDSARYDMAIAARIVANRIPGGILHLDIHVQAPDGSTTIERVGLPLAQAPDVQIAWGSGSVTDLKWPWRSFTATQGHWRFLIQPADPAEQKALYGLGFSYTLHDGKR